MLPPCPGINIVYSKGELPELKSPYLICGFPGSGYVGKIAVDHLIEELHARHLADIYSTSFPPQVLIRSDGTADLMKNSIFYSNKANTSGASLLLLTGDSQPANPDSEYILAEEILNIATKFNTSHVFTLAAYITGVFVEKPRIFGTATDTETIKSFSERNISAMDGGSITGMNGLIIGTAKLRGIRGTCLLGETSGYVVDAKASKSILETLLSIIGIEVDMKNLEKRAKDTETLIETIEQQMSGKMVQQQTSATSRPSDMGYIS
jgi:uncharacterized protein (TIGR00162 family)